MQNKGRRASRLGDCSVPSKTPSVTGSRNVLVNSKPVLRVDDVGLNGWRAVEGAACVLVNGRHLHRLLDEHSQCQSGQASANTVAGDHKCAKGTQQGVDTPGLRMFCKHKIDGRQRGAIMAESTFEVVQAEKKDERYVDEVTILYKDPIQRPPDVIHVQKNDGENVEVISLKKSGEEGDGYSRYVLETEYQTPNQLTAILLHNYVDYELQGLRRKILVRQRDPRKWQIEFKSPTLRTMNIGVKLEGPVHKGLPKSSDKKETFKDSGWEKWSEDAPVEAISVKIDEKEYKLDKLNETRDTLDKASKAAVALLRSLSSFLFIVDAIHGIVNWVKENVPKVGWYLDFEVQILDGSSRIAWQWKEHTDHRAFQWFGLFLNINLLKVSIEFGFGLSIFKIRVQIYVKFSRQLSLESCIERVSPDSMGAGRKIIFKIEGALGARFGVGDFVKVEAEGSTELEFEIVLLYGRDEPFALEMNSRWNGVKAKFVAKADVYFVAGEYVREWSTNGIDLGKHRWPAKKEYNPPTTTRAAIEEIINKQLTQWWNTNVYTPSGHFYVPDTYVDRSSLVKRITDVILSQPDVRRDAKTIEGLGDWIGAELSKLESFGGLWYKIHIDEFNAFLARLNVELARNYIDPCRVALKQLSP